jgi:alpha-tubulin suppressor-like RCC1 family protein
MCEWNRSGTASPRGRGGIVCAGALFAFLAFSVVGVGVARGESVQAVTAGHSHNCALTAGGGVLCWGSNFYGQLGDGTTTDRSIPVAVTGLGSGIAAVAAGDNHTCALTTGGGVLCWGYNDYGQLGDGTTAPSFVPVAVSGLASGVAALAGGSNHTCAVTTGGEVLCWGDNFDGQLGNPAGGPQSSVPVAVSGLASGIEVLAASLGHTCAGSTSGAWCWGSNSAGQLGDGSTSDSVIPVAVIGLGGVVALAAGFDQTCAITTTGGAVCWGSLPAPVSGLPSSVSSLAAGSNHTCAGTTASAWCWGSNFYGQLGDGTNTNSSVPVGVLGLGSGVAALAAGHGHTCALDPLGAIWCWGRNNAGQLGDGTNADSNLPVAVTFAAAPVPALGGVALALVAAALALAPRRAVRSRSTWRLRR